MPKIIDGLQASILSSARRLLFEKGYTRFTLRAVAADCSIAVGTIYNYFPNKLMLVASVMAEDWYGALEEIQGGIKSARELREGLYALYGGLRRFCETYEPVWGAFSPGVGAVGASKDRRTLLRSQLSGLTKELLQKFSYRNEPEFISLFVECILSCALQGDIPFESLYKMCGRLFEK